MKYTKKQRIVFLRSFSITLIMLTCLISGLFSAAKVYENTVRIGYGKYRLAFEWNKDTIRIFDFEIKL